MTWDNSHLYAELADGTLIEGEANIDVPKHDLSIPTQRVYLKPEAQANPEAVQAIRESDFIIFAPDNLYTSTIPNLLVTGIPEALHTAWAPLIYILNLMTRHGETDGYTASQHVTTMADYAGRLPDAVIVHRRNIPEELARKCKYKEEEAAQVKLDVGALYNLAVKVVKFGNVMSATSLVRHDPARTARVLIKLFGELDLLWLSPEIIS